MASKSSGFGILVLTAASGNRPPARIGLYGDVDLNYIDGSAIWLVSLAQVLSQVPDASISLFLKAPLQRDHIAGALAPLSNVEVVQPTERLSPKQAASILAAHDATEPFDACIVRGFEAATELARTSLAGRLWVYLTDIPQNHADLDASSRDRLEAISRNARLLLCQTEQIRAFLESVLPAETQYALLPPMIPDEQPVGTNDPSRLVYAGKFAPAWAILEMVAVFEHLRTEFPDLEFHVVGDKIHNPPEDPDYSSSVRRTLESTAGLHWHGALTREETGRVVASSGIALSARTAALDSSLELSTKILEYAQSGAAVVMNRTPIHEDTFGPDYPLFVENPREDLERVLAAALRDPSMRAEAGRAASDVASRHRFGHVASMLGPEVDAARSTSELSGRRIVVASHDLKFAGALLDRIRRSGAEVQIDDWNGHNAHDASRSKELAEWADLVVCEWFLGNVVWYTRNTPSHVPIHVRFHRMELETGYPDEVRADRLSSIVFVSDHIAAEAIERFGWHDARTRVIPNSIRHRDFARKKLPGAEFRLGMVGMLPSLKRLDWSIATLEILREHDCRFSLAVRGQMPWDLEWLWNRQEERDYYEAMFDRINTSPSIAESVLFEGPGPVAPWLQTVGYITSFSDTESFHLGLVEGMASGAVPLVRRRPGSEELFGSEWLVESPDDAARVVLRHVHQGTRPSAGLVAQDQTKVFDDAVVLDRWIKLLDNSSGPALDLQG